MQTLTRLRAMRFGLANGVHSAIAEMVRIREEAWLSIVAAPDDVLQGNSTPTPVLVFIVIGKRRSFFYSERQ